VGGEAATFTWDIDEEDAVAFFEKVDLFATVPSPGHQYLNVMGEEDAIVIVSYGEYPDELAPDEPRP